MARKERVYERDYAMLFRPDHPACNKQGYVYEHRLIMEEHLQRLLSGKEVVHHIDENPRNNDLSNLQLCADQAEHRKLHCPKLACRHCDQKHYARGLCRKHYRQWHYSTLDLAQLKCKNCGKPIHAYPPPKTGMCRNCKNRLANK